MCFMILIHNHSEIKSVIDRGAKLATLTSTLSISNLSLTIQVHEQVQWPLFFNLSIFSTKPVL